MIIEIVGAAGVGKTTFLTALKQHHEKIRPIDSFKRKRFIPVYACQAALLLPFLVREGMVGRWYPWREMNRMIRLKAIHQILEFQKPKEDAITIMDQGPIYTLTILSEFGSENTKNQYFVDWWEEMFNECVAKLDLIIWLDAPDEVLLERIRSRDKKHLVKYSSDQEAFDYLMKHRNVFKKIMGKLTEDSGPKVLHYNTSQCSLIEMVKNTSVALNHWK